MINAPTVAVIVPVLNEGKRLSQLLDMLETLHADEVVLVDGRSIDGSATLLSASRLRWIQSSAGRAVQMNAGAGLCSSDALLFLHADTEISSESLSCVRNTMQDSSIVGGRFDVALSGAQPVFRVIEFMVNLRSRLSKISTGDQAMFVRRDVFEKLGGFPDQPLMEDIELSKRLKQEGDIACLRDKVTTSSRRWEQYGMMETITLMWKLRLLYWLGVAPEKLVRMYRHVR